MEEFILTNATSAFLLLEDWPSGGCPMERFEVEVTRHGQMAWRTASRAGATQGELELTGLLPGTWYLLKVTAFSEAGNVEHTFSFATRTMDGGKLCNFGIFSLN